MREWLRIFGALLVLAGCGHATPAPCDSLTSLYNESYAACIALPACMDSFYLTPAHHSWEHARFNLLLEILLDTVAPLDYTTICNTTQSFDVWMALLSNWNFCHKNEMYSELSGDCVCRRDKNCDETMNGTLGYASVMEWVLVVLLFLAFLYYTPAFLKKCTQLEMLMTTQYSGHHGIPMSKLAAE